MSRGLLYENLLWADLAGYYLSTVAAQKDMPELLGDFDVRTKMNVYAHATRKQSGLPQGFQIKWKAAIKYIQKKISLENCP